MSKNIVFCADGTWNGVGHPDEDNDDDRLDREATNVLRLFAALAGQRSAGTTAGADPLLEQEKVATGAGGQVLQVAKYLHGVGDSKNLVVKVLGGVFGEGFVERIVRGYTFISRNYEDGDKIFLVGFSRGAYTVRALAGMIVKMGLLQPSSMRKADGTPDEVLAYQLGGGVWAQYRRNAGQVVPLLSLFERTRVEPFQAGRQTVDIPIEAIGVWDTVGALGVPFFDPRDGVPVDLYKFADQALSTQVRHGFHAVSVDEERVNFTPTLWDDRDGVLQVLFAGAHADVGGGYPEQDLSNWSLAWLLRQLVQCGLLVKDGYATPVPAKFIPSNRPWDKPPFNVPKPQPRKHPENILFHRSVQQRLSNGGYEPESLKALLQGGIALPEHRITD